MSESYIGLAPSYGVFEKQVIAGTTATSYPLDFDVVQATQLMVSLDGIVQEPDYAYSVGRSATGTMQLTFASALTEQTASSVTLTSGSTTISAVSNTGLYNVGQPITGNANIPANTFITAIPIPMHCNGNGNGFSQGGLVGVLQKQPSVIMLTFTVGPGSYADFYSGARPPC